MARRVLPVCAAACLCASFVQSQTPASTITVRDLVKQCLEKNRDLLAARQRLSEPQDYCAKLVCGLLPQCKCKPKPLALWERAKKVLTPPASIFQLKPPVNEASGSLWRIAV